MTITYSSEVATVTGLGCFWHLLFRWKGSIYKLLWPNLIVYSLCYAVISATYRYLLTDTPLKQDFERVATYCKQHQTQIPVAFILGFYVRIVVDRWWGQYTKIPWPDKLAMYVGTLITGKDDRGRLMRRTIMRYANLGHVIVLRMMSPGIKKRFPTYTHLVEAGFLQPNEKKIFEDLDMKYYHPKYWMPLVWAGSIVTRARKEGRIKDDFSLNSLIDSLNFFREGLLNMLHYDWICIPLVYTQVVTLAVYFYFGSTLMGSQFLNKEGEDELDLYVPVFIFLQFFFYMGWLKVAETLVNPFGENDDDFELNWLVDRNIQVSYVIVDEMHQDYPEMVKDQYWDDVLPTELPYTEGAKQYQTGHPLCSTDPIMVSGVEAEIIPRTANSVLQDLLDEIGEERRQSSSRRSTGRQRSSVYSNSSILSVISRTLHRDRNTMDNPQNSNHQV